MKKGIKRVLSLICALLVLVLAMSACGGGDDNTTASNNSSTDGDTVKSTVEVPSQDIPDEWKDYNAYAYMDPSATAKPVRFATWIDHFNDSEGAVPLSTIEADTGLKVEIMKVEQSSYVSTLMTKIASGDIPDVFVNNETTQGFPLTLQIAAPINKVSSLNLEEPFWDQSAIATGTIDGNVYLINAVGSPWFGSDMVFYNKTIFEENGFKTPEEYYAEGNWTWDNMLKCAKEVKNIDSTYSGMFLETDILTGSMGTSFVKYDYKTATFSNGTQDPKLLEAYEWYAKAKEEGYLDGSMALFTQGKCGLGVRGPYGLKASGYWTNMNPEDVGFTYLPTMEAGDTPLINAIYRMYGIVENAPNPEGGAYFLRYFLDYRNYDLDNAFLTVEAGNFYYELTNTTADQEYFTFDGPVATLVGDDTKAFWSPARNASQAGMKAAIDSVSNLVDTAVAKANDIIQQKIEADRIKYAN